MTKRIFVSATFADLEVYRQAVRDAIRQMDFEDVAMEYYVAENKRPLDKCLSDVSQSDCYLGLFAFRYGFIPPDHNQSITELEYRAAREAGLHCLIFIVSETHPWPPKLTDSHKGEGARGQKIKDFREELEATHLTIEVTTAEDCAAKVLASLHKWSKETKVIAVSSVPFDSRSSYLAKVLDSERPVSESFVDLGCKTHGKSTNIPSDWPPTLIPPAYIRMQHLLQEEGVSADTVLSNSSAGSTFVEVLKSYRRFLLSGPAGGGKTTSLRFARWWAAKAAQEDPTAPVPLWMDLANWPDAVQDFTSFIVFQRETEGAPIFPADSFFLLVDGLNELDPDLHESRLNSMEQWIAMNPAKPIIVSTRPAFARTYTSLNLPLISLEPLDDDRIQSFVARYLSGGARQELLRVMEALQVAHGRSRLVQVVSNPFYLGLLCYLARSTPGRVPTSPALVSRLFIQTIFERDSRAEEEKVSYAEFVRTLGILAVRLIEGKSGAPFSRTWASKFLGPPGEAVLGLAQDCGILVLQEKEQNLRFEHQILLEYLAAEFFLRSGSDLSGLASSPVYRNGDRVPGRWDEVLQVIFQLQGAARVLESLATVDPVLVLDTLGLPLETSLDADAVSELKVRVIAGIVRMLRSGDEEVRLTARSRLVASAGEAVRPLRDLFSVGTHFARRNVIATLKSIGLKEAWEVVLSALLDENRWVRRTAREALIDASGQALEITQGIMVNVFEGLNTNDRARLASELSTCWPVEREDFLLEVCRRHDVELFEEEVGFDERKEVGFADESESDLNEWGLALPSRWATEGLRPGAIERAKLWLQVAPAHLVAWSFVWCAVAQAAPTDGSVLSAGKRWLQNAPQDYLGWSYVFSALWDLCPEDEVRNAGLRWLQQVDGVHPGWPHVWRLIFREQRIASLLEKLGLQWLGNTDNWIPGREFILCDLLRLGSSEVTPATKVAALQFLSLRDPELRAWSYVWRAVKALAPDDEEVERLGLDWLRTAATDHPAWGYVWPELWKTNQGSEVLGAGRRWLSAASVDNKSWTYIWIPLWDCVGDEGLRVLGFRWLESTSNRSAKAWSLIWRRLWQRWADREALVRLARVWLDQPDQTEDHRGWAEVWCCLWRYGEDADLRRLMEERMTHVTGPGAGYLFKRVFEIFGAENVYSERAMAWLRCNVGADDWLELWRVLRTSDVGDPQIVQASQEWLDTHWMTRQRWDLVYKWLEQNGQLPPDFATTLDRIEEDLRNRCARGTLWARQWEKLWVGGRMTAGVEELGLGWLADQRNYACFPWPFLWGHLRENGKKNSQLLELGRMWLENVTSARPAWNLVWGAVIDAGVGSIADKERGLQWLGSEYYSRSSWPDVWLRLWEIFPEKRLILVEHGRSWCGLQKRPHPQVVKRVGLV